MKRAERGCLCGKDCLLISGHSTGIVHRRDQETLEMIKDLPYYYDEPFSDSSQLPTMLVSRMAPEDITVALSGDGGDELQNCGYQTHDWTYIAQRADWMGSIASQAFREWGFGTESPAGAAGVFFETESGRKDPCSFWSAMIDRSGSVVWHQRSYCETPAQRKAS